MTSISDSSTVEQQREKWHRDRDAASALAATDLWSWFLREQGVRAAVCVQESYAVGVVVQGDGVVSIRTIDHEPDSERKVKTVSLYGKEDIRAIQLACEYALELMAEASADENRFIAQRDAAVSK